MALHWTRFPGESSAYRESRDKLLQTEMELRKNIEQVAALRRHLPPGGELPEDYLFEEGAADLNDSQTVRQTRFSELFQTGKDALIVYSYMYSLKMQSPCTSCTSIIDSLNGASPHVNQRVNLVVIAKSPIARIRDVARSRNWRNLRLLSSANNSYNRDYHAEDADGSQLPVLNVFTRRNGKIQHFFATELLFLPPEAGQDRRHVDLIWPLWNLFDFTPDGRGTNWYPKLNYT
jgi:predicted dithiol-disulfide oxidoreductase (DUF899 family)